MQSRHPVEDGLRPIAIALRNLAEMKPLLGDGLDLEHVRRRMTLPFGIAEELQQVLTANRCGRSNTRRERLLYWLRTHGQQWAADDLEVKLRDLLDRCDAWSNLARDRASKNSVDVAIGRICGANLADELSEICSDAQSLHHTLKDLAAAFKSQSVTQYVTLDQIAAICSRSKRTAERWVTDGKLPDPAIEGGGGNPNEWDWRVVRSALSQLTGKALPENYPVGR